jgi:hypothetical protein
LAGLVGLALLLGVVVSPGAADDKDEKSMPKEVREGVLKVAADLAMDKAADATKDAAALKGKDLKFPMRLFKLRKNHGFGVGDKAGAIDPDGIERKVEELGEKAPAAADLAKEADALKDAGYRMAAIAAVAEQKVPAAGAGMKTPKNWAKWCADMRTAGIELAKAAEKKDGAGVQKASKAAQAACTACHDAFRDE